MRTDQEQLRQRSHAEFVLLGTLAPDDPRREEARDHLVALHLPLVKQLARRLGSRGEPVEDLIQVGTIGLIKAVDRFELDRGVEFSTYATPTIVGEIKRWYRDKGWAIRVPRRLQELRMAPTVTELADHLEVSEDDVLEALDSANAYSTLSLDAPESAQIDCGSLGDSLGEADDALDTVELRESLRPVLETLPRRERTIVCLRFFRQLTQSQIAAEVGMSQMHVSRLLSRSLSGSAPSSIRSTEPRGSASGEGAGGGRQHQQHQRRDRDPGDQDGHQRVWAVVGPGQREQQQLGDEQRTAAPGLASGQSAGRPAEAEAAGGEEQPARPQDDCGQHQEPQRLQAPDPRRRQCRPRRAGVWTSAREHRASLTR